MTVYIAGYKADPATMYEPGTSFETATGYNSEYARKGELWSFCSGVLPFLHAVDPTAAETLLTQVNVNTIENLSLAKWTTIKSVFSATNLNKMGVKCADVGGFVNQDAAKTSATTLRTDFEVCTDDPAVPVNADADTAQCTGEWTTKQVATTEGMTPAIAAGIKAGASAAVHRPAASLPAMLAGLIIAGLFAR